MPYTSLSEIERQKALAQSLRGQDFNRASNLSGLAHVLRGFGAGRLDRKAREAQEENERIRNETLTGIIPEGFGGIEYDSESEGTGKFLTTLLKSGDPELQKIALNYKLQSDLKQMENKSGANNPSSVREYEYRKQLPGGIGGDADKAFLEGKRQLQFLNTGNTFTGVGTAATGQNIPINLKPADMPENAAAKSAAMESAKLKEQIDAVVPKAEQEAKAIKIKSPIEAEAEAEKQAASITGKALGEAETELADREAIYPRLEEVVKELSELGKKATYTKAGQLRDTVIRESGGDVGEGAIARTEYISKVDNEILPLLRQTFGAQFTEREGQSLKATLGDPDKSPAEKDAVLRSFIATKKAQIENLRRRTGQDSSIPEGVTPEIWEVMTEEERAAFK